MTPQPDRLAMMDQLGADMKQWAGVYGEFRKALVEAGYEPHEALEVVLAWQEGRLELERLAYAAEHNLIITLEGEED